MISQLLRRVVVGLTLSVLPITACSSEPSASRPPKDELSYELHSWATELGPDVLAQLTDDDRALGTLRFHGAPAAITQRVPGDVLVAGKSAKTPKGLLRLVVSVGEDGGDTVVETLPVPLPLAFKRLHAKLTRNHVDLVNPPPGATSKPAVMPQSYKAEKVVGGKRNFDTAPFNLDQNLATKDDQLLIHAELEGEVGFQVSVDLGWLDQAGMLDQAHECLKKIIKNPTAVLGDCIELPDVKIAFSASLAGNALLDVDGAASKEYISDPITLNEQPWELPDLYAGPVVLSPELDFTAKVSGDAATYFHARTEFGYDVSVSAAVGTVSGVTPPQPKFTKHVSKPTVSVSSTGHTKASFGPRLTLLAYDTFGFSVDLHGFGELTADQAKTPCWDYALGIEIEPGIRLRIPWQKFGLSKLASKLGWDLDFAYGALDPIALYKDHPFAGAPASELACDKPPVSALPLGEGPSSETYQTPTFSPWSFRFGNVAATEPWVQYPGQSHALVDKTHASSWLVSGASLGAVLHLTDAGSVAWARAVGLGLLPDEEALALDTMAGSALALASDALDIFVASDRLTLLALDYDGSVKWARRLRVPSGLPGPELRELTPVAITRVAGGDFAVLYSRRVVDHPGSEVVLLRVTKTGSVRFAKRFAFPTGDLSLGSTLVPVGQDLVVTGLSFEPTQTLSYVMRFDGQGDLAWSERVDVCGSSRVRIEAATLRASGGLALLGTYDSSPERVFFASLSAAGAAQTAHANWTGSIVEDVTGVALAELPTSGFVTLERYTPSVYTSNALELSTRDSLGARTEGKGYALKDQAGTGLAHLHPAGLRLTTDGGAIVVAHVTGDGASNDDGLWVSKIPARTFQAPFDAHVSPAPDAFPEDPCSLAVSKVVVQVADLELEDVDVTPLVSAKPIVPVASQRTQ